MLYGRSQRTQGIRWQYNGGRCSDCTPWSDRIFMEWLAPIVFSFIVTAAAVIGLLLVRRRINHAALVMHNDVASAVFSVVGTLFTVLLAFVVIVVWQSEDKAAERTALEAGILGDLMRDAGLFPDPGRTELRNELREYGQAVINEEWPAMANGGSSPHVWDVLNRLFESFSRLKPAAPWEVNIHSEMLTRLNDLSDHRRLRLHSAVSQSTSAPVGRFDCRSADYGRF